MPGLGGIEGQAHGFGVAHFSDHEHIGVFAQGIEKGATVINEIRVITKGKTAKLFINGTPFRDVKGQPPKDGSLIGLLACSPNNASAHMAFDNLVVNPTKRLF